MRALALLLVGTVAVASAGLVWYSMSPTARSSSAPDADAVAQVAAPIATQAQNSDSATPSAIVQSSNRDKTSSRQPPPSVFSASSAKDLFDPVCQSDGFVVETCDCLFRRLVAFGGADVPAYIGLIGFDRLDEAHEIEQRLGEPLLGAATRMYGEGAYKACAIQSGPGAELRSAERVLRTGDPLPDRPLTPAEEKAALCPEGTPKVPSDIGYIAAVFADGKRLQGPVKQRTSVSRALILEPKCLLLDEPISDLEPINSLSIEAATASIEGLTLTVWTPADGTNTRMVGSGDTVSVSSGLTVIGMAPEQSVWADITLSRERGQRDRGRLTVQTPSSVPLLFFDHLGNRSAYWTYEMLGEGRSYEIQIGEITPVDNGTAKISCNSDVSIDCQFPPQACRFKQSYLDLNRLDKDTRAYLNLKDVVNALGGCSSPAALPITDVQSVPNSEGGFDWIIDTHRKNEGDLILIDRD